VLQAARSRVASPDKVIGIFNLPNNFSLGVDSASYRNEYHEMFLGSRARPERIADLTTCVNQLCREFGILDVYNPKGLHGLLQG
jgi:hypothetical protein